jgi:hypothetical protein
VLEDADGDGKADRFTHLADTLNIPIGVLPVPGGAVAHSIPNLYRFATRTATAKPKAATRCSDLSGTKTRTAW